MIEGRGYGPNWCGWNNAIDGAFRLAGEGASELMLTRHAEPSDAPAPFAALSCAGERQASLLAERLVPLWVEAVYSGPEPASRRTAETIARRLERPLLVLDAIRDIDFSDEAAQPCNIAWAEEFARIPVWDHLPGFEKSETFRRRVIQAVEGVLARHPSRRTVVVTTSSVINAYLTMVMGVPGDMFFSPDYAAVSILRSCADRYAVVSLNDGAHLRETFLLPAVHAR